MWLTADKRGAYNVDNQIEVPCAVCTLREGWLVLIVAILLWSCLAYKYKYRRRPGSDTSIAASGPKMANRTEVGMKSPLHERQTSDYFGPSVSARPLTESVTSPSVGTPS
ncbi:uncharacterized protein RSE6_01186 [Rhynchosporium secalis]|uniref:Uncharacterized protein n=1 Tax=Rhynchosporium secalis TaxID=38038 RepID=A0A1E1LX59_RHYSE|nr:uncharacterized protein RSE6_01186 [Rhynchosporium secalis]